MSTLPPTDLSCHRPESTSAHPGAISVALVGLPNTGKSTLFNRLTGGNAHIANWPGLTVDLQRGTIRPGRQRRRSCRASLFDQHAPRSAGGGIGNIAEGKTHKSNSLATSMPPPRRLLIRSPRPENARMIVKTPSKLE